MDIINEQLNRTKELMGLLYEQQEGTKKNPRKSITGSLGSVSGLRQQDEGMWYQNGEGQLYIVIDGKYVKEEDAEEVLKNKEQKESERGRERTDQELLDIIQDDGKGNLERHPQGGYEFTNQSTLYRSVGPDFGRNRTGYQWKNSDTYDALVKAKWSLDAVMNQNDKLVKNMMRQGTTGTANNMSREDVKRFFELMIEGYTANKSRKERLESYKSGIKGIVDIYERELGIDRNTQRELEQLLSYLTNKEKNGFDNDRWDVRSLKRKFPNAVTLLPPSKVMDIFCKLKK